VSALPAPEAWSIQYTVTGDWRVEYARPPVTVADLSEALEWALDQIDDDPDPDHRAALDHARAMLARALGAEP